MKLRKTLAALLALSMTAMMSGTYTLSASAEETAEVPFVDEVSEPVTTTAAYEPVQTTTYCEENHETTETTTTVEQEKEIPKLYVKVYEEGSYKTAENVDLRLEREKVVIKEFDRVEYSGEREVVASWNTSFGRCLQLCRGYIPD